MKTRLIIGVLVPMMAFGQAVDSLKLAVDSLRMDVNVEFLYQRLMDEAEALFEEGVGEALTENLEDLLLEYEQLRDAPLNVNSDEIDRLAELGLLNTFQIEAVKNYRKRFGNMLFVEELMMIEEINEHTFAIIAPIVYCGQSERTKAKSKHQITMNYAMIPTKLQLKYSYMYGTKWRMGLATNMKKDADEPSFLYGFHCYANDLRLGHKKLIIIDFALGDYQLCFGQGLTLWSGMSFGKTSEGSSVMKRGNGIRPKTSASEGKFFRGVATTLRYHDFQVTAFYSNRRILEEQANSNTAPQQVYGGRLCYSGPGLELGYTVAHSIQDERLTNMGMDFRWQLPKMAAFGEVSMSSGHAFAGLAGATFKPAGYINFTMVYRNYGTNYQNPFFGALKESSRGQAEEGYYLGVQCAPAAGWDLVASSDFFRLKWITSQLSSPSWGQEHQLRLLHQINRNASMQFRFKSKTKMKNTSNNLVYIRYPIFYNKRTVSFRIDYSITESLTFSDKVSYSHYLNDDGADSQGYFICHDIAYKPANKSYSLTFRYALFDSDDYNSRITMYENDVLGAFSIPSFNGLGSRVYLLGKAKLFGQLSIYSRIGLTLLQENAKTDFKVELIWK